MPKSSCIEHPKRSRYITIWDHYVRMLNEDCCAAALMSVFEFLTNGELDQIGDCSEEVWLSPSQAVIEQAMFGLYKPRSIRDAIRRLEATGLLETRSKEGQPNIYRFRSDRVQEAIKKKYEFKDGFCAQWSDGPGKNADGVNDCTPATTSAKLPGTPAVPCAKLPGSTFITNEEGRMNNEVQNYSSSNLSSEEFSEQPTELHEWISGLWVRHHGNVLPPTPPSRKYRQILETALAGNEPKLHKELLAFWESGGRSIDDFVRQELKRIQKPLPRNSGMGRREADSGRGWIGGRRVVVRDPQNEPSASVALPLPPEAEEWNAKVPQFPVGAWKTEYESSLRACRADPNFVKCWPKVLDKCAAIAAAGNTTNLPRVLKGDWVDIVNGVKDWLAVKKQTSAPASTGNKVYDAMEALKQKLLAGTKKGKE